MPFLGGIGPGELILVLVIALIVFGPKRLPELGGSLGKAIREFRRASNELTRELSDGIDDRHVQSPPASQHTAPITSTEVMCQACGGSNPSATQFCGYCGKSLAPASTPPPSPGS